MTIMNWRENVQRWRSLSQAEQQRISLARSATQVWQSMAFEREMVSLSWLQAQHERLLAPPGVLTPRKVG